MEPARRRAVQKVASAASYAAPRAARVPKETRATTDVIVNACRSAAERSAETTDAGSRVAVAVVVKAARMGSVQEVPIRTRPRV